MVFHSPGIHPRKSSAPSTVMDSFVFQERRGKLDLRAISRVDIDKVIEEGDIGTLQTHLDNITFCKLDAADLKRCGAIPGVAARFTHFYCDYFIRLMF